MLCPTIALLASRLHTVRMSTNLTQRVALLRRLPDPSTRQAIRTAAGVTLLDVATEVGVTPQAVSAWEHGVTPGRPFLAAYLRVLDALRLVADEVPA